MTRSRTAAVLSLAALAAGVLLHVTAGYSGGADTSEHAWGADDAYISYRYAENLNAGHGLVFNPGERVEGYSNLLFVALSALLLRAVGADWIYPAVSAVNLLLLTFGAGWFYRHCAGPLGVKHPAVAAWLLALCPGLWLWAASGMETILVVVLQMALWIQVERLEAAAGRRAFVGLAGILSLLVLVRADGFGWVAVTVVYLLIHRRFRLAARTLLAVAPTLGLLFAWRAVYYGELLPNTYAAKVSEPLWQRLQHGAGQLYDLAFAGGLLPYLLVLFFTAGVTLLAPAGGRWSDRLRLPWPCFFGVSLALYWVYVGGDPYEERFLLVLFPLGIVVFLRSFAELEPAKLAFLAALLLLLQTRVLFDDPRFDYTGEKYDCWVTLGRFLGEQPGDPLLAVDAAGKIPFFSGLRTLDMRGLTDRHIARVEPFATYDYPGHNKRDPDYVLARRPNLIAAWVQPNLDLVLGLDRERYRAAGYRLRWMLNTSKRARRSNVVDVRGAPETKIRGLIAGGYRYAVLTRTGD